MTIQKIRSSRVNTIEADQFTGEKGMIFYNEKLGDLRVSDGKTVGGILLSNGSGSGSYNLPIATENRLGGVKIGNNITITNGIISVTAPPTDISQLTDTTNLLTSNLISENDGTIISSHTYSINFTGNGVTATAINDAVTVEINTMAMTGNLDGGYPFSVYGGIQAIDGGTI